MASVHRCEEKQARMERVPGAKLNPEFEIALLLSTRKVTTIQNALGDSFGTLSIYIPTPLLPFLEHLILTHLANVKSNKKP